MGRKMFCPVQGTWPDESWKGGWGDNPPYHCPVFVLTRHARASLALDGGKAFHFVTGGIQEALARVRDAAQGQNVRVGGGVATVRQYLQAVGVNELHLALSPTLLGRGEVRLAGIDMTQLGFRCLRHARSPNAWHVMLEKE
jgi:dihydrofolate reductase